VRHRQRLGVLRHRAGGLLEVVAGVVQLALLRLGVLWLGLRLGFRLGLRRRLRGVVGAIDLLDVAGAGGVPTVDLGQRHPVSQVGRR
jgi:hypothetical protein